MMRKKVSKSEKGITLTALVVMIVMMMILAGTSIHLIKNGEKTLNDSKAYSTMYKDSEEKTAGEISTMEKHTDEESRGKAIENGSNTTNVTSFLGDSKVITIEGNHIRVAGKKKDTTTQKYTGYNYDVTVDTTKDPSEYDADTKNALSEVYGTPIKFTSDNGDNAEISKRTWRIFYIDFAGKYSKDGTKGIVYLKADWYANDFDVASVASNYTTTNTAVLEKMNSKWWSNRSTKTDSFTEIERETEYLCDTNMWKNYFSDAKTSYAIGSPSIEMFCDSYNSVNHSDIGNYKLTPIYNEASTAGYVVKLTDSKNNSVDSTLTDSIDYKNYNSMYCGASGEKGESGTENSIYWWFSSPSSNGNVMYMNSANASINTEIVPKATDTTDTTTTVEPVTVGKYSTCPVVSLKTGLMMEIDE